MFIDPYSEAKAAHVAAYFLKKAGGSTELLKLMKLMYLAERESYSRFGEPLIGDEPYADRHGPVLDSVYKSASDQNAAGPTWKALILSRDGNSNNIKLKIPEPKLTKLSHADRNILEFIWLEFGGKTASALRKWTHKYCSEYSELSFEKWDPRAPIDLNRLLTAVGFSTAQANERVVGLAAQQEVSYQLLKAA